MLALLLLQSAIAPASERTAGVLAATLAGSAIGAMKLIDYVSDRRRERARDDKLDAAVTAIGEKVEASQRATDARCDTIERQVSTLSAHIIGPDGENGIRGDLREVKKRVIGLEDRERERLSRTVGTLDRRTGS